MIKLTLSAETREGRKLAISSPTQRFGLFRLVVTRRQLRSEGWMLIAEHEAGEFLTANHLRHSPVHGCGNLHKGVCMVAATCTKGCARCRNHTIPPYPI